MSEYINTKAELFYGDRYFKSEVLPDGRSSLECPRDIVGSMGVAIPWSARGKTLFAVLSK